MQQLQVVNAAELASAYAAADYSVRLDGDVLPLRVGEPATDLETYWPAGRYVFITAWNPSSQPTSDPVNLAANARLAAQIDALGLARNAAWAKDGSGDWCEPGWVVADLPLVTTEWLAREFGQAAVLAWQRGEPVRLRMLLGCSRNAAETMPPGTAAFTDWVE